MENLQLQENKVTVCERLMGPSASFSQCKCFLNTTNTQDHDYSSKDSPLLGNEITNESTVCEFFKGPSISSLQCSCFLDSTSSHSQNEEIICTTRDHDYSLKDNEISYNLDKYDLVRTK